MTADTMFVRGVSAAAQVVSNFLVAVAVIAGSG